MKLAGKGALVTGAGTGIGREVALELAREGADVVLSYHGSRAGALSAVAEVEQLGRRAAALPADVSVVSECKALVDQAIQFLGHLDVLVNNAGLTFHKDFFTITEQEFDLIYAINIRGEYFCAQQAAKHMREQGGGVIINMLSIHGLVSYPQHSLYDGTKGAILAWTRELALELAPYHIRVVGVAPGAIEVERYYREDPTYRTETLARQIPCGRVGWPMDVAKLCAFLASDDAGFIVGTTVVCDGGTTSRMALGLDDL
jgi:NAD(P)-dependent dehydrogenase (short-subunit alcohol dehydrogenase family)